MDRVKMNPDTIIESMLGDKISNYIIPGLDSSLLSRGTVRLFRSSREFAGEITPHNHRFDFACYVLSGRVINRIYSKDTGGDEFTQRELEYGGQPGEYIVVGDAEPQRFKFSDTDYREDDWYFMSSREFHSIYFSRGAKVLFFEGPTLRDRSEVLLPYVNDETIETMQCNMPWMFQESK